MKKSYMCRRLLSGIVVARHTPHIKVQSASVTGRLSPPSEVAGGNRADGQAVLLIPSTADAHPISSAGGRICFREVLRYQFTQHAGCCQGKKAMHVRLYLRSPYAAETSCTERAPASLHRAAPGHSASDTQAWASRRKERKLPSFNSPAGCAMLVPYPSRTVMKNKKLLARSGSRGLGTVRRNAKAFRSWVAGAARLVCCALRRGAANAFSESSQIRIP